MSTTYIVLTRFCIRGQHALDHIDGHGKYWHGDPLITENISYRLSLLKVFAAQSLRHQTFKKFRWVILIDDALPLDWQAKVQAVVDEFDGNVFRYQPGIAIENTAWIPGIDEVRGGGVVTINHDDDDMLPADYLNGLVRFVDGGRADCTLAPVCLASSTRTCQWDLVADGTHYGTISPWPKNRAKYASTGFSLICESGDFDIAVTGLNHGLLERYFRGEFQQKYPNIAFFRKALGERYPRMLESTGEKRSVYDMKRVAGPILISNHGRNVQRRRIYEPKKSAVPVFDKTALPYDYFDWDLLMRHREIFVAKES